MKERRHHAPRGYTYSPCPGCKKEPRIYYKKGEVCDDCKQLLKDGHIHQVMIEKMRSLQDNKKSLYVLPSNWCKPVFYKVRFWNSYDEGSEEVGLLLKKLAYLFAESVEEVWKHSNETSNARSLFLEPDSSCERFDHISLAIMRKDVAETLDELYLAFHALLKQVGRAGYEHGSNILAQLASGEISTEQFNKEGRKIKI